MRHLKRGWRNSLVGHSLQKRYQDSTKKHAHMMRTRQVLVLSSSLPVSMFCCAIQITFLLETSYQRCFWNRPRQPMNCHHTWTPPISLEVTSLSGELVLPLSWLAQQKLRRYRAWRRGLIGTQALFCLRNNPWPMDKTSVAQALAWGVRGVLIPLVVRLGGDTTCKCPPLRVICLTSYFHCLTVQCSASTFLTPIFFFVWYVCICVRYPSAV